MVSALCALFLLVFFRFRRRFGVDQFDPMNLYLLVQFGALAIAYLKLSPAMSDWLPITWVVFLGSAGMFCVGSVLARQFHSGGQISSDFPEKLVLAVLALFVAWAILGLIVGIQRAGIPLLAKNQTEAKKAFDGMRFSIAFGMQNALLIFSLSITLLVSSSKRMKWIGATGLFFGIGTMIVVGVRNPVLFALFLVGYGWSIQVRPIRTKEVILYVTGFTFLFLVIAMLRLGMGLDYSWVLRLPKSELIRFASGILTPLYEYISNNLWNLDYNLGQAEKGVGHPITFGFSMLDGFFNLPGIGRKMQEAFGWDSIMNETSRKIYYLNTVSYQWTLFKDFGLWGVLTVSCLWGWCATWMHRQAISCKNPVITVLSGTFQFSVFFGFFAWYFVIPSYLIAIVVMAWLARLSSSSHREAVAHAR